jgi:YHS domain-containing protein
MQLLMKESYTDWVKKNSSVLAFWNYFFCTELQSYNETSVATLRLSASHKSTFNGEYYACSVILRQRPTILWELIFP